jgi:hypothetical protein
MSLFMAKSNAPHRHCTATRHPPIAVAKTADPSTSSTATVHDYFLPRAFKLSMKVQGGCYVTTQFNQCEIPYPGGYRQELDFSSPKEGKDLKHVMSRGTRTNIKLLAL